MIFFSDLLCESEDLKRRAVIVFAGGAEWPCPPMGSHFQNYCSYLQEEESSDSNKFYPHLMKPMSNRER